MEVDVLRVLHVISGDLWAGAEAQVYTLISNLVRMPGIEAAAAVMNEGELAVRLRQAGVKVFVFHEQHRGPIGILFRLRGLMNEWRPDIVHTHREKENILGAIANWSAQRVPSVRTAHGGPELRSTLAGFRAVRRQAIERLDRWCAQSLQARIVVVSRELAKRLSHSLPAEKMVVIENGVDAAALSAEVGVAEFRVAEPTCVHLGIIGRLVNVKRVDLFLQMAALLSRSGFEQSWRFHIFGDGPFRAELEVMARRFEIACIVTFHGHRQDIATCIAGLDAVVMCSDHEGMPMAALEATALGVPLIAHAVGALPEITPAEFLVTEQSATAYAQRVRRALQSDGQAISRRKAEEVLARLSAENNARRVRTLYEQVIAEANPGPSPPATTANSRLGAHEK
jgi:glycosyltransferase involved in cell wall biosynthesis